MAMASRILLIDPSAELAGALATLCQQGGEFTIDHFHSAALARAHLDGASAPDVVIADASPSAAAVCADIREAGFAGPVVVTGTTSEASALVDVRGIGAQGALIKPFRYAAMMTLLRQIIREYEQSAEAEVRVGAFVFKPGEKVLEDLSGTITRLTDKETAILRSLHRAKHQAVPRETLLEDVWGYNSGVQTHTLETHIYRLRQKLEPDTPEPEVLVTSPGGYRLITSAVPNRQD